MARNKLNAGDLLKALDCMRVLNGMCRIALLNKTPAEWSVTILAAGVKFHYRDGSTYQDGPRQVNLGAGALTRFNSDKPDGCVDSYFVATTVKAANEPNPIT